MKRETTIRPQKHAQIWKWQEGLHYTRTLFSSDYESRMDDEAVCLCNLWEKIAIMHILKTRNHIDHLVAYGSQRVDIKITRCVAYEYPLLTSRNSTRPISPSSLMQSYAEPDCRNNCAKHISSLRNPDPILSPGFQPPCWPSPPSAFWIHKPGHPASIRFGIKMMRIGGICLCHEAIISFAVESVR